MLPIQNFEAFITRHSLFTAGQRILLAVSGGKDSVLMTHLFKQAGYEIGLAHCNFNLRGDESQRDESFVRLLASTLEIPLYLTQFATKDYAVTHKISTQMAARKLRYDWFETIRQEQGYDCIALAQHQDDAIETVLLNLTRGTGIAGLHGILPKRDQLIRPLLFLSRKEIDQLVEENDINYVEDSSNLTNNYARNKIRLSIIPPLKELNPSLEQTFMQNIQRFADTEQVLQQVVAALKEGILEEKITSTHLSIAKIKILQPQKLLCYELLKPYGFTETVITDLLQGLDKQSGTSFYSRTHRITIDREDLILTALEDKNEEINFIHLHDEHIELPHLQLSVHWSDVPYFERDNFKAFADASLLIYPLIVRKRQPGDKFKPMGMQTFKKLSDFLIDEKVPLHEKDLVPLILNGNGEIIWVAGLRQDDRYKITASTKKIAIFQLQSKNL